MSRPTKSAPQYFVRAFSLSVLLLFANAARAQNTISTVAGGAPPNNVAPTAAPIEGPQAMVRDSAGNLYVVNDNGVIYKVTAGTPAPSMSIFAGNNTAGFRPTARWRPRRCCMNRSARRWTLLAIFIFPIRTTAWCAKSLLLVER